MVKQVEDKRPPRKSPYQRLRDSIKFPTFKSRLWDIYKRVKRASKTLNSFLRSSPIQFSPFPGYAVKYNGIPTNIYFYDFEVFIYEDECNTTINVYKRFIFGFYEISQKLHFRNPNCGSEKPPLEEYEYQCNPSPKCEGDGRAVYIWWRVDAYEYRDSMSLGTSEALFWFYSLAESTIESVTFPDNEFHDLSDDYNGKVILQVYATITTKQSFKYLANFKDDGGYRVTVKKDEITK